MPIATRLTNSGTYILNGEFDEVTKTEISVTTNTVYAKELDEITLTSSNSVKHRQLSTGIIQVADKFDEFTGAIVADPSLVLWLDAGQETSYPGSGTTWTDLSGNGRNGTLVNVPTYSSANGGSIVFNGTNNYVNCGTYQFNTTRGSICCWFKPTTNITSSVTKRLWGSNDNFEARWNDSNGRLTIDIGASQSVITAQTSWLDTTWYNLVVTWDSSITTSRVYIQGTLNVTGTTGSSATLTALTGSFFIATSSFNLQYLDASIAHFTAYNRVLSADEVTQNFDALRRRFGI